MGEAILHHLRLPEPTTCHELDGALPAISNNIECQLSIYSIIEGNCVRVNVRVLPSFEPLLSNSSACANIVPYSLVHDGMDKFCFKL